MNIRIAVILSFAWLLGCGGAAVNESPDQPPREGPEDAREAVLPDGPDVDKEGIRPSSEAGASEGVAEVEVSSDEEGSVAGVVSRTEVESFRDRGPAHVLTLLEFEPVHSKSGFVGFSVKSVAESALSFTDPHIRTGDVVTHVNGIRMERPDDLLQAWNAVGEASVIRVDMIREGTPMHVSWAVEE